ncbi:unnamed protein product [Peniophora sp. CBMAI 1063]|nr:unnamed protein product [Peniophora sp. CBMAI 1063]
MQASVHDLPDEIILLVFAYLKKGLPAGRYNKALRRTALGWVKAGHVCSRWRQVLLENATLWTDVTSFYDVGVIEEFKSRSRDALLNLDIDLLCDHALGRSADSRVVEYLTQDDLWERSFRVKIDDARSVRYRDYLPSLAYPTIVRALTRTSLTNLVELRLFIPREAGQLHVLSAPCLRTLCLKSDAAEAWQCLLVFETFADFLSESRHLQHVQLQRAVDSRFSGRYQARRQTPLLALQHAEFDCFDEGLVALISQHCFLLPGAYSNLDIFGVRVLNYAIALVTSFMQCSSTTVSARIARQRERAYALDGVFLSYRSEFYALRLAFARGRRVTWRKDLAEPSWTWDDFANAYDCQAISSLHLHHSLYISPEDDPSQTNDQLSTTLLRSLGGLQELNIEHESHFDFVRSLPITPGLKVISVKDPSVCDLVHLWHFIRRQEQTRSTVDVTLTGRVFDDDVIMAEQRAYDEAPLLAAVGVLCNLNDRRVIRHRAQYR